MLHLQPESFQSEVPFSGDSFGGTGYQTVRDTGRTCGAGVNDCAVLYNEEICQRL